MIFVEHLRGHLKVRIPWLALGKRGPIPLGSTPKKSALWQIFYAFARRSDVERFARPRAGVASSEPDEARKLVTTVNRY